MCDTPFLKQVEIQLRPGASKELKVMEFPCGKCLPCKQKNKAEWLFRMEQELKSADLSLFVTLTYDTENLPFTYMDGQTEKLSLQPTLDYRDVQKYLKRIRKAQKTDHTVKYFCVGEYGTSENKRPHYHMIIFNVEEKTIAEKWGNGTVHCGDVTPSSIQYCLNYLDKGNNKHPDGTKPEFRHMSKGIGDPYYKHLRNYQNEKLDQVALSNGQRLNLPRYYTKQIFSDIQRAARAKRLVQEHDERKNRKLAGNEEKYYFEETIRKQGNRYLQKARAKANRN